MSGLGRPASAILATFLVIVATTGCKDDEPVRVRSLKFHGVTRVSENELRAVLATKQGSWIPFSKKPGFNRNEFTRDLQRVTAFYADRGYPDAKVTAVDADLDAAKKTVALNVTVAEGAPVIGTGRALRRFRSPSRASSTGIAATSRHSTGNPAQ